MDNPIDYSAEVARIYELTYDTEREDAYASLASRLREDRDAKDAVIDGILELLKPGEMPCECVAEGLRTCAECEEPLKYAKGVLWMSLTKRHARAIEIAGRKE